MKKFAMILSILLMAQFISAQIIHVPGDQTTIQAAIDVAVDGDTILVAEGIYYENINFNGKAITVASKFILDEDEAHIAQTIIDGSKAVDPDKASVVTFSNDTDTTSILKGFTVTGGAGSVVVFPGLGTLKVGGGINLGNTGGKIVSNIVTNNQVYATNMMVLGGGISSMNSNNNPVVIRNNLVQMNEIKSNTYAQGGGINAGTEFGFTLIEQNHVTKNRSTCTGTWKANAGGIMLASAHPWDATLIVRDNSIYENEINCEASQGGGIFLTFITLGSGYDGGKAGIRIYNNLIANNYSQDRGGGLAIWDQVNGSYDIEHPNPLIYNNSIVGNTANEGAGIFNFEMNALLFNNIIWNNSISGKAREISMEDINYNVWYPNRGKFQSYFNNIKGAYPGVGNIEQDPLIDQQAFTLDENSPSIGRGIDSVMVAGQVYYAPEFDYEGTNRLMASTDQELDQGAIESLYNRQITEYDSDQVINVPDEEETIQAAIDVAVDGDTVLVKEGVYYENINYRGKAITVASKFMMDEDDTHISQTVIDGSMPIDPDTTSVVILNSGEDSTSVLNGFTITGGEGSLFYTEEMDSHSITGGGVLIDYSGGKIINNTITENSLHSEDYVVFGAGVRVMVGDELNVVFRNNRICNNVASSYDYVQGAGLGLANTRGYLLCEDNEIANNISTELGSGVSIGGGICMLTKSPFDAIIIIRNNRIIENEIFGSYAVGAGIYSYIFVEGTAFRDEVSNYEIYNNIIADNISQHYGGGIAFWGDNSHVFTNAVNPVPIIYNNTITGNKAEYGGGMFNHNIKPLLFNNIFWNESTLAKGEELYNGTYSSGNEGTFLTYYNCIQDGSDSRYDFSGDPNFMPGTYEFYQSSLCIDRGAESIEVEGETYYAPPLDMYGNPRPYEGNDNNLVDLGAIESEFVLLDYFEMTAEMDPGNSHCGASVKLVVEGGIPPYRFYMDGVEYNSNVFEGLCEGTIEFEIVDTTGIAVNEIVVISPSGILPYEDPDLNSLYIYPNPANQMTTIRFNMDDTNLVRLSIFNLLGQEQLVLLSEERQPGEHEVQFDVSQLKSGIYFVRLISDKISTCKLVVA